ncbi:response regulator transcription factor [Pseudoduganella lutea]|uniref:Response regulator transcription factor n=1 Tax=Pseudoduganella lutea TaxID=321985 RepID=A0A4P6L456_9BURK|nr:response regulator transcription factor [Pseudoduganella lutea]QBE66370.1 response regulator transcription factor [Pseudoduganella lutea]
MPSKPISVLLVDDHPLFRQGLTSILDSEEGIALVGEATTGREALARCHELKPDVVIMDIRMPEMNGIEASALIRRDCPSTRVIVLTTFEGDVHAMRAIKAGAAGYMLKSKVGDDLANAIRTVHGGGRCIAPSVAVAMADHMHADSLSQREIQVLELAAFGKTNKLIGVQLGISEATVKVHMKSILSKLDANDRTHAVMLAVERGIIDLLQRGS